MRVVVADVDEPRALDVARSICDDGGAAIAVRCDVTDPASVQALAERTLHEFGSVNLLCLNAGVVQGGTVESSTPADLAWVFEVNVFGAFYGAQVFVPHLRAAARRGELAQVLITGSEHSLGVPPHAGSAAVYTASKHALLGLAQVLRRDVHEDGVGVTIFCPSNVATDLWDAKRTRPERHGGPLRAPEDSGVRFAARGRTAEDTAHDAFVGMEEGAFLVLTDERMSDFVTAHADELLAAVARSHGGR
jgi:NAD(P)-dependent dehydrogenase (short-subunit alcohol dehydrogenase family)